MTTYIIDIEKDGHGRIGISVERLDGDLISPEDVDLLFDAFDGGNQIVGVTGETDDGKVFEL